MNVVSSSLTTTPDTPSNRRRQVIVNPAFQWKYAITIMAVVFVVSCILSSLLYGLLHNQARMRLLNPMKYTTSVPQVVILFSLAFSFVTACGVGVWLMYFTHRVCGPLKVMHRYFDELASGKIPSPRPLRNRDEFKDVYGGFVDAMTAVRTSRQAELNALTKTLNLAQSSDQGHTEPLGEITKRLRVLCEQVAETLGNELDAQTTTTTSDQKMSDCVPVGSA